METNRSEIQNLINNLENNRMFNNQQLIKHVGGKIMRPASGNGPIKLLRIESAQNACSEHEQIRQSKIVLKLQGSTKMAVPQRFQASKFNFKILKMDHSIPVPTAQLRPKDFNEVGQPTTQKQAGPEQIQEFTPTKPNNEELTPTKTESRRYANSAPRKSDKRRNNTVARVAQPTDLDLARQNINLRLNSRDGAKPKGVAPLFQGVVFSKNTDASEKNIERACFVSGELKKRIRSSLDWIICAIDQPHKTNIPDGLLSKFIQIVDFEYSKDQTRRSDKKKQVEDLDIGGICSVLAKFFSLPEFTQNKLRILGTAFHFLRSLRNGLEHRFHIPLCEQYNDAVNSHWSNKKFLSLNTAHSDQEAWEYICDVLTMISPPHHNSETKGLL